MSDKQRMTHPDVEGAEIWASDRTRPSREAAGWVLDDGTAAANPASVESTAGSPAAEKAPRAPKES